MGIQQLSIPLPNRPGQLSRISDLLGDEGINIRAITAIVHGEDARIHLVVDNAEKAREVLEAQNMKPDMREVIAVETPDHPGGLNAILRPLHAANVNIEFCYPMIGRHKGNAVLVIGADPVDTAIAELQKHYIAILDADAQTG